MVRAFSMLAAAACATATVVATPALAQEPFNGPYVGVQAGWQRDSGRLSVDYGATEVITRARKSGFEYGAQLGYDGKLGDQFVVGAEAFFSGATGKNELSPSEYVKASRSFGLLGRAGVLATPQTLVYATGGWENARFAYHNGPSKISKNKDGWTIGAGIEQMIDQNVGVRLEYRYSRFGNSDIDAANALTGGDTSFRNTRNRVTVGVNYRF